MTKNNFLKKFIFIIKESFMSDDIKKEIKNELLEPFYIEIINFILPHYIVFMILFVTIIFLLICIIMMIASISKYK